MSVPWSKEHYHLRDGKVSWSGYEVKGADLNTFEPLNHIWARDAKRVYTQHSVNKLADRETFEVLNHIYAKDKDRVFYLSGWIKEADAKTFRVLDEGRFRRNETTPVQLANNDWRYSGFGCDATQVFYDDMLEGKACIVRGADPKGFQVLEFGFAKDGGGVYYEKHKLKRADPNAFRVLSRYFSMDGRTVFYFERPIAGADAATFEILGEYWARDVNHIYFQENVVSQAERATFELVDFSFGRDRQRVYGFLGAVVGNADPASFEQIGESLFYRDNHGVYFTGYPNGWLDDADPATFEVGPGYNEGRDRAWWYQGNQKKKPRDATR